MPKSETYYRLKTKGSDPLNLNSERDSKKNGFSHLPTIYVNDSRGCVLVKTHIIYLSCYHVILRFGWDNSLKEKINMDKLNSTEKIVVCSIVFVIVIAGWIGGAFIFKWLWNFLSAEVFHSLPQIGFWHSFAILAVMSIIGSFFKRK